jgi:3-methyladenine DNA glycosylase AlkC
MIDVPRALRCLHALTQRFSAEFAIRPFIAQHPQPTLATLTQWVHDPSVHVRRLVSEGSRPRLPWGQRLQLLVRDPAPTLPLLRALQDDPSAYVRRSVANHLNDIAKDHPELVAQWVHDHRLGASAQRTALLRHASRTLIKQGHAPTLAAWGLGQPLRGQAEPGARPCAGVAIGDTLAPARDAASASEHPQTLVVDYVVHHVRANGSASPKVFKGWNLMLPASGNTGARQAPQPAPGDHAHAVPRHTPHRTAHQRPDGGRRGF